MSINDAERQLESNDLARTKWLMGTGLASCNPQNWNEWLADDVVLSLKLSAVDMTRIGDPRGYSGVFSGGREKAVPTRAERHIDWPKQGSVDHNGSHKADLISFCFEGSQREGRKSVLDACQL